MVPVPPSFSSLSSKFLIPPQTQMIFSCTPQFQVKISCPPPFLDKMCCPPIFFQSWLSPPQTKSTPPRGVFCTFPYYYYLSFCGPTTPLPLVVNWLVFLVLPVLSTQYQLLSALVLMTIIGILKGKQFISSYKTFQTCHNLPQK